MKSLRLKNLKNGSAQDDAGAPAQPQFSTEGVKTLFLERIDLAYALLLLFLAAGNILVAGRSGIIYLRCA